MPQTPPFLQRLSLITGEAGIEKLSGTGVLIFGLGGVGSWCAEALARSGAGRLVLVDSDAVCVTNINRQVQADFNSIGMMKAEALKARLLAINPELRVDCVTKPFDAENAASFPFNAGAYVIDAIDSLGPKIALIQKSLSLGKTLFSSMGMAQKLDPLQIRCAGIWKTESCPLARLVRRELRKQMFTGDFTAVYSPERLPLQTAPGAPPCGGSLCLCPKTQGAKEWCSSKKVINGSAVAVTATAGMILASLVVRDALAR
ncbi:MAG: tRNA threonylcarbamoyladenosine dehydratase [Spirochaetaceae bacterium]|jgi:tRNA A37 threonylcarbamoyladenosine dehydratase|nr:tRNA threonylcarbamoyladenosine dehydratase [Spirochaetaceae bacterium]